ncbi:MAG: ArnT family glycosyltransferase [Alphaproteobacteria bacterium]
MTAFLSQEFLERKHYWAAFALVVYSALLFLPGLGARDLWAPGEPIYGDVIWAMYEKNNWLVPMLNGQLYADKPVLYFWLALVISKIAGGVNEWTLRLPAALGGLGLVLVTFQFGKTFYNRRMGLLSALVLATSARMLWEARFLRLDTVLSFFLFLGFYFWLTAFTKKASKHNYLLGYLCFGLATLTKGPIGLALPGFAVLSLILFSGRWREIREMRLVAGFFLVAFVLFPWLWLLHLRGEDQWLRDFIWVHNVQNFALKPIGHVHPFYYYFFNLPPDFLPWTLLIPGALIYYYPWRERLRHPPTLGSLCWFTAIFVFFSASKSKIAYYLLPLLPSLALFVGAYLNEILIPERRPGVHWKWTAGFLYLLAAALGIGGVVLPAVVFKVEQELFLWSLPAAAIALAGGGVMFLFLRRGSIEPLFLSLLAVLLGTFFVAAIGVFPYLDGYKSPRSIAEYIRYHLPKDSPVYVFKSSMADFNYYARRESIPVVSSADDVAKLSLSCRNCYLLVNEKDVERFKFDSKFNIASEHQIGEKKWYLLRLA